VIRGRITYRGLLRADMGMARGEWAALLGDAMVEQVFWWHAHILPGHFVVGADTKYGYAPRTERYMKYKRNRFGHEIPLVLSGEMRRELLRKSNIAVSAIRRGKAARGVMRGPKYLYQYLILGKSVNKAAEITTVTKEEVQILARGLDQSLIERMKAVRQQREVRI
jgi:hypothetical protein